MCWQITKYRMAKKQRNVLISKVSICCCIAMNEMTLNI